MTTSAESPPRAASEARPGGSPGNRFSALDSVRGFAVVCMVVDHLCVVFSGPAELRLTVGRLALPLFFLTAGRVLGPLRWRHARIAAAGILLPVAAPWIDSPNVLVWYVLGAVLLASLGSSSTGAGLVALVSLGVAANGWMPAGDSYPPLALWGLMAVGALLPVTWWSWGDRLPAQPLLRFCGRHALELYVGHVLLLTGAAALLL